MVRITKSEKRSENPQVISLGKNTTLTTWGLIKVNQSHFFPSSFQIKAGDEMIYIDPVEVDTSMKADYILLTHAHPDHFSLKDIKKLIKPETRIICSRGVWKKLKGIKNEIQVVRPNDSIKTQKLQIDAIAAYNTKSVFLWIKAHPKSRENVGFILTLDNEIRIYHAGDTDYIPEMDGIANIDLALIPIGGDNLTMNVEEAAEIINQIRPKVVVPMHFEFKKIKDLKKFEGLIENGIEVKFLIGRSLSGSI